MIKGIPHVTLTRNVWRSLVVQAAGHSREAGGIIIGRRTRAGTYLVEHDVALAHIESDKDHVRYDSDEVAKARQAAYHVYGPKLEPLGGWHVHPWGPTLNINALLPQLSDDDVEHMMMGEIELIVATTSAEFPRQECDFSLVRTVGDVICKAEVSLKKTEKEIISCTISVR